jgi:CheY-like chemotaxis protein
MTQSDEHKTTLLIIDDEPAILRMLVEALSGPELTVLTVHRGEAALELYRRDYDKIDLVLLDMQMYPQNGFQILGELRRINPHIRAAFMSGSPLDKPASGFLDTETIPVFAKPFTSLTDLAESLKKLVDSGSRRSIGVRDRRSVN